MFTVLKQGSRLNCQENVWAAVMKYAFVRAVFSAWLLLILQGPNYSFHRYFWSTCSAPVLDAGRTRWTWSREGVREISCYGPVPGSVQLSKLLIASRIYRIFVGHPMYACQLHYSVWYLFLCLPPPTPFWAEEFLIGLAPWYLATSLAFGRHSICVC